MTLSEAYERVCSQPSDINEHCPTLRRLAEKCEHVTEFGFRYGTSATALAAGSINGRLKRLVSYDISPLGPERELEKITSVFTFIRGNSLEVIIEPTDMLFIDTKHTGWHLKRELERHHHAVGRWIVMHDTEMHGEIGEGGRKGLKAAVRLFLRASPQWFIAAHYANNNGLTVFGRWPLDKPAEGITL